jgi:hypothetical protein
MRVSLSSLRRQIYKRGRIPAGNLFLTCQGRVYSLTLLANFLVGIHFRRDDDTTDVSTQSRRGPNPSVLTGAVFDVIHGYDTESASHNPSRVGAVDSKAPSARLSHISVRLTGVSAQ